MVSWVWRDDDSAIKSIGYSSREPTFNSQHPHGSSQPSVTPVPGNMTPSHRHTFRQNTIAHKIIFFLKKKRVSQRTRNLPFWLIWLAGEIPRSVYLCPCAPYHTPTHTHTHTHTHIQSYTHKHTHIHTHTRIHTHTHTHTSIHTHRGYRHIQSS
jgi:hypothetical protein